MKRADHSDARRQRAREALIRNKQKTLVAISVIERDLEAFRNNEKSLSKPPVSLHRDLEILKRDLDRQTMEIAALEKKGLPHG